MRFSFLLVSVLVLFGCAKSDNSNDKEECAQSLVGLAPCLPYVGGTAKAPAPDCCSGLKQVLKTNKKCLCVVIKHRNDPDLGFYINFTLAVNLLPVCNTPANLSQCPALLNLPPNSPDAQVYYQISNYSSTASSPGSGGHNSSVESSPTSAPAGTSSTPGTSAPAGTSSSTPETSAQQKSACFCIKNRWLRLILLWALTSNFVYVK